MPGLVICLNKIFVFIHTGVHKSLGVDPSQKSCDLRKLSELWNIIFSFLRQ